MPISETLRQSLQKAGQSHLAEVADALEVWPLTVSSIDHRVARSRKMHELVQTYVKSTPTFVAGQHEARELLPGGSFFAEACVRAVGLSANGRAAAQRGQGRVLYRRGWAGFSPRV